MNTVYSEMNGSHQNTYQTLSPLSWILKIFLINSNIENTGITFSAIARNATAALVLGTFTIASLCYKIKYVYSELIMSIKITDATQMIFDYCQYIVDLYFVYKYGRLISVEYFKQYEKLDKILGIISYKGTKTRLVKLILFYSFVWALSSGCDFTAWIFTFGWMKPLVFSVGYIYLYIKMATMLDLISHVMHIELRLTVIGDIIQAYYMGAECCTELINDHIFNKNWLYSTASSRSSKFHLQPHPIQSMPINGHNEIKWLTRCYLMLTEQVAYINSMYGFRILLNSLSLLIDMIRFTNISVRIVFKSQITTFYGSGYTYLPAISCLMRLLTCIAILVSLADHCEKAYQQSERITTIIDHLLIYKKPDKSVSTDATELRQLLSNRPIFFNMANFFIINYSFLASIASIVVTYTIILLQSPD